MAVQAYEGSETGVSSHVWAVDDLLKVHVKLVPSKIQVVFLPHLEEVSLSREFGQVWMLLPHFNVEGVKVAVSLFTLPFSTS